MRIEITDRALWLAKVDEMIAIIEQDRAKIDGAFEANWRASENWWASTWIGRILGFEAVGPDAKPPYRFSVECDYPTIKFGLQYARLRLMRKALISEGSGAITLDDDDLGALG